MGTLQAVVWRRRYTRRALRRKGRRATLREMTTRVLVVRHGETFGNIEGRFCGHSETELTPLGVSQAEALGRRRANTEIDAAYASDLTRAARTAEFALAHGARPALAFDRDLREMYYGDWEGLHGREIGKSDPGRLRDFFTCKVPAAPGGESIQDVRTRTSQAVLRAVEANRDGTVLVVSNGNAIMAMLAEFLRLPIESSWSFAVHNTSMTWLHFSKSNRFTLVSFNDAAHTEGLGAGAE
jgi:broad specificity phosphatase PhoE